MKLDQPVHEILETLNKQGRAVVYGGYIRDKLADATPNDIDIATSLTISEVKILFPQLTGTEAGLEFGVGRFRYKGWDFEIASYQKDKTVDEWFENKDFTINTLYHDGINLYDPYSGLKHIEEKILVPCNDPYKSFTQFPQAYLRAFRLSSKLDYIFHPSLIEFLSKNHSIFMDNHENRIQSEGYEILRNPFPLNAIYYLQMTGLLSGDENQDLLHKRIDNINSTPLRFSFLSLYTSQENLEGFADLFSLSKNLPEKLRSVYPYLLEEQLPEQPKLLNEIISIKREQYRDDPNLFKKFIFNVRNNV